MSSPALVRIGQAQCPFAIDHPVPMPGFGARTERSVGALHPAPRASAVAFEDVVVVALDLLAVDPALAAEIAARVAGEPTVLVTATHTHAGPGVTPGRFGGFSQDAREEVIAAAATATAAALASRVPASLDWMSPAWPGLAHDRRVGRRSELARLRALRWSHGGQVRGWLVCYPCHPTVIGPANLQLSPDYPGWLRAALEDGGAVVTFLTGCAGDLNAGHTVAASYELGAAPGRAPGDAERFGEELASVVASATWQPVDLTAGVRLAASVVSAEYSPLTELTPAAERAGWEQERATANPGTAALLSSWIAWSHDSTASSSGEYPLPVAVLGLGEATLCLLPGEPFLAADLALTEPGRTIVAGYYGDVPGYLPAAVDYPRGGYEVLDAHRYYGMPAPFRAGTLERLVAEVTRLRQSGADDG